MHLKRAIVGLLALGGIWFTGFEAAHAQGISSHVAVCDPKFPTHCAAPDASGNLPVTGGGGGGGSTATASAAPTPVIAGTGKPFNIDLFSAQFGTLTDGAGNIISPMPKTGGSLGITNTSLPSTSVVTAPTSTPTISTSAYTSGFVLGGIQSFTSQPNTGAIANANVTFNSGSFSSGTVDLYFFNASPTGGGTGDHAAFALTSTDTGKLLGVFHLNDCTSLGGVLAQCQGLYQSQFYGPLPAAGTTVFAVAVVRGTPTFAGTTDAIFSLQVVK